MKNNECNCEVYKENCEVCYPVVRSTPNSLLSEVAKDIIAIEFDDDTRFGNAFDKFFEVMRKHHICAGTKTPDGVGTTFNSYEWTMCRALFESHIQNYFMMKFIIGGMPSDIESY